MEIELLLGETWSTKVTMVDSSTQINDINLNEPTLRPEDRYK